MPTKRILIFIFLLFVISFSATFFMIRSNDHKECEIVIKKEIDKDGKKKEHVCKEKYSL